MWVSTLCSFYLLNIWMVSSFDCKQIMLLCVHMYMYLSSTHMFLQCMEKWKCWVTEFTYLPIYWILPIIFSKAVLPIYIVTSNVWKSLLLHILFHTQNCFLHSTNVAQEILHSSYLLLLWLKASHNYRQHGNDWRVPFYSYPCLFFLSMA